MSIDDIPIHKLKLPKLQLPAVDKRLIQNHVLKLSLKEDDLFATSMQPVLQWQNQDIFVNQVHMGSAVTGTSNSAVYWILFKLQSTDIQPFYLLQYLYLDSTLQQPDFCQDLAIALQSIRQVPSMDVVLDLGRLKPEKDNLAIKKTSSFDVILDLTYLRPKKAASVDNQLRLLTLQPIYVSQKTFAGFSSAFTTVVDPLTLITKKNISIQEGLTNQKKCKVNPGSAVKKIPYSTTSQQWTYFQLVFYPTLMILIICFYTGSLLQFFKRIHLDNDKSSSTNCYQQIKNKMRVGNSFVCLHFVLMVIVYIVGMSRYNDDDDWLNYLVAFFTMLVAIPSYMMTVTYVTSFTPEKLALAETFNFKLLFTNFFKSAFVDQNIIFILSGLICFILFFLMCFYMSFLLILYAFLLIFSGLMLYSMTRK